MEESRGLIIGVAGRARVGKDIFTNYLVNILSSEHNREFKTTAFAHRLKQICLEHFNLNREQLWGNDKEIPDNRYRKNDITKSYCEGLGKSELSSPYWTPREIMQNMGTFYRSIDANFWVRKVDENWKYSNCPDLVITDVRMPNECEYVKSNGLLIKVVREDASAIHNMAHESETSLDTKSDDYFDIVVDNNGTLEDLQIAAYNTAKMILELEQLKEKGRII